MNLEAFHWSLELGIYDAKDLAKSRKLRCRSASKPNCPSCDRRPGLHDRHSSLLCLPYLVGISRLARASPSDLADIHNSPTPVCGQTLRKIATWPT